MRSTQTLSSRPAMFRALRHRNYRLFFFGQLISLTGTWMQSVAQGWLVLRLTDSPFLLGLVAAANSLPVLFLTLFAGTVADRFPKRRILLVTQSVAMILAATLAGLTLTGTVHISHVLILAFLLGCVNAFDAPARQAFTVEMVGREDLLNAIALNSSIFNGARTMGPAVAGIVVAWIGEGPAFLFNALSFGAVLASLSLMQLDARQANGMQRGNMLRAGLQYIASEPSVRALLLRAGAVSFFCFVHIPLLPIFARDILQIGAAGLGWLSAASGFGSLVAALTLAQLRDDAPRGKLLTTASLLYAPLLIGFTQARTVPLALLFIGLCGWAGVTTMALTNTLIQLIVPDDLRGRVMSVFTLSLMGLSPLGGMLAGSIAELVGSVPLVVAGSALIGWLLVLSVEWQAPYLRRM
ncbi:MFS transporter [Chloroflexus sp.]|uniref:MFS transporter n=1 Tax=Chloroflexus sp. TaxID=1904827 RepID=UPI000173D8A5|nr:MFS transporter [Chloroflexus sp.]RMG51324.1 MAG: MFS transporter [Chloroflexota bacterium]GIV91626.1 MAG: MFS transporter [Chloroflexus sp.]